MIGDLSVDLISATVQLEQPLGDGSRTVGTGFLIHDQSPDGKPRTVLVTAAHVFEKMPSVSVRIGYRVQAADGVWRYDPQTLTIRDGDHPLWVKHAGRDVAAIVVTPIRHDVFADLEEADPAFAHGVRAICDRIGAALVVDDVRCGLRLDLRGSWEALGVRADLSAWSKSLANGHALAVLLGAEAFREAASGVVATGSFWMAGAPMAAALATIALTAASAARMASRAESKGSSTYR